MPDPTLTDAATWTEAIYELQTTDEVRGGPGGVANRQAQELANRTAYLHVRVADRVQPIVPAGSRFMAPDVADRWVDVLPGGLYLNSSTTLFGDGTTAILAGYTAGAEWEVCSVVPGGGSARIQVGDGSLVARVAALALEGGVGANGENSADFTVRQVAEPSGVDPVRRTIALEGRANASYGAEGGCAALRGGSASGGGATVGGSVLLAPGSGARKGNVWVGAVPSGSTGMQRGMFVANAVAAPTSNPVGGFCAWSEEGVPHWRGNDNWVVSLDEVMTFRGAWAAGASFRGDVKTYAGGLYRANATTGGYAPNVSDGNWTLLAPAPTGDANDAGRALVYGAGGESFVRSVHRERNGAVQTTDATTTTVLSWVPDDDAVCDVTLKLWAKRTSDGAVACFRKRMTFVVAAGVVTAIDAMADIGSSGAAAVLAYGGIIDTDGTEVRVRATGVPGTGVNWLAMVVVSAEQI